MLLVINKMLLEVKNGAWKKLGALSRALLNANSDVFGLREYFEIWICMPQNARESKQLFEEHATLL